MKKIILIAITVILLFTVPSSVFASKVNKPKQEEITVEKFKLKVKNKENNFKIVKNESKKTTDIYISNLRNEQLRHIIMKKDQIFEEIDGKLSTIAVIETFETELLENVPVTFATEPKWGGLTSQTRRATFSKDYRQDVETITGVLIGMAFTGASLPYSIVTYVAEKIFESNAKYADLVCYYHVAAGCPQYLWYKKYVYKNNKGNVIKTYNMSRKAFIGVQNVPSNPPMCRLYGY